MAMSVPHSSIESQVGVYECEVTLRFRILEESRVMHNREHLLELLIDAFSYGSDEFVEAIDSQVEVSEISAFEASPSMRRQLIRMQNLPLA
ncbi:MAG: Npun_R1517 family heterocyst differentiation transcriptional regulator [Leptolyngbyaceae cyanobacterium SM2_3_12]|nr:Npun_R1517 family heterocyst differentiation transcriptional regulator [Leptolyngbyaceae cyanobacterium SM2_3_12]